MSTPTQNDLWNRVQKLEAELASTKGTDWSKMNRLELLLAEKDQRIRQLEEQVKNPPIRLVPRQGPDLVPVPAPPTCPVCGILISTPPKVDC